MKHLFFQRLIPAALVTGLFGCGGQTVAPPDQFYRFPTVTLETGEGNVGLPGRLLIEPFDAGPLYQDRAMLFSSDPEGLRLEQHHYHHWVEAPVQLVRRFVLDTLRQARVAESIETGRNPGRFRMHARLLRFERHRGVDGINAVMAIRVKLIDAETGHRLLNRHYETSVPLKIATPLETVNGLRRAAGIIMDSLVADLNALLPLQSGAMKDGADGN